MSLAVARETVQTAHHVAECSKNGVCDRKRDHTAEYRASQLSVYSITFNEQKIRYKDQLINSTSTRH